MQSTLSEKMRNYVNATLARHLIIATLVTFCTTAAAQESIYDRCLTAIEKSNSELVTELAKTMKRFTTIPAREWKKASKCVSSAEGLDLKYDPGSGAFVDATNLTRERAEAHEAHKARVRVRVRVEEQLKQERLARWKAADRLRQLNEALIFEGIYSACSEQFRRDKVAAMTNALCVKTFEKNGHPLLSQHSAEND